jgi:hypothetical protein
VGATHQQSLGMRWVAPALPNAIRGWYQSMRIRARTGRAGLTQPPPRLVSSFLDGREAGHPPPQRTTTRRMTFVITETARIIAMVAMM